jgi:hypothetical protein
MQDTDLAQQLIDTVRRTVNAEAALVQDRVAYALEYMNSVATPNMKTLSHIEWILTGKYDSMIALNATNQGG